MNFLGNTSHLHFGINAVFDLIPTSLKDEINIIELHADHPYCLEITRGDMCIIAYKQPHHFFRALGLYLQFVSEGKAHFNYEEKAYIPTCGAMIDCSRNSVYKISKLKTFLLKLAIMGHSTCMLYTEDTYQIAQYPYFGYLRGAYTEAELKELDDYAYQLGIELIPCIQTLAHLRQALRWNFSQDMKDTDDVLLVGDASTYTFIDAMLQSIRTTFRTNRIHIGMDEAFDLGRGQSLSKNGFKHHNDLMTTHLQHIEPLLQKYGFKAMMWDDMFLRTSDPDGDHYAVDAPIDPKVVASVPSDISLVYWDYYHLEEDFYIKSFVKREVFDNPIIFAGGVWKWTGYAPSYDKTFITTHAALNACKKQGIQEVLATMWGDDGDETPLDTTLLGLMLFAEHTYLDTVDDSWLNRRIRFLTGLSMDDFMSLQELDLIPGIPRPNVDCHNPSKPFLYQDILLGAFDYYVKDLDLYSHYAELAEKYEGIADRTETYNDLFIMYANLARTLSIKANIGCYIYENYKKKDTNGLITICEEVIPMLILDLKAFQESLRNIWFTDCKGQGFEILDIRLGGIISRLHTTHYRLDAFISDPSYVIEELEEERLPFKMQYICDDQFRVFNHYVKTASQSVFSHGL